ncbi:MAG: ABC transporter ATP-binding protein [bacterium]|nr:MAG: ABC transporter ATP-binding protein [bacterium]
MPLPELLTVEGLSKVFPVKGGVFGKIVGGIRAVDDVSFRIMKGEVFGMVGESGCGKTTLGRMILGLLPASSGRVIFDGDEITSLDRAEMRPFRRRMQIIFQDPVGSLNPRKTVGSIVGEPLRVARRSGESVPAEVEEILRTVGLPEGSAHRYPHEFSGGQRQRIGIARALILRPDFLLADEPVSALDVSIQAQILTLLVDLKTRFSLTMMFISHDLRVVRSLCDRVGVMYLGRLVEVGAAEELYSRPMHPYTEALIEAIPEPDPSIRRRSEGAEGEMPSPSDPPPGCHFHTRCPLRIDRCFHEIPALTPRGEGRLAACHVR